MNRSWMISLLLISGTSAVAHADDVAVDVAPRVARWPAYLGVSTAIVGIIAATIATLDAADQAERARGLYRTDPRFIAARSSFERDRGIAIAGFSIAAGGIGLATYWYVSRLRDTRITARIGSGQAMLTIEHVR